MRAQLIESAFSPDQPWSGEAWNVTQVNLPGKPPCYIGRISLEGPQVCGADPTEMWVLSETGERIHKLFDRYPDGIQQIEDLRVLPQEDLTAQLQEPVAFAGATIVFKPQDEEHEKVTWGPGIVGLGYNAEGRLEAKNIWILHGLAGKNTTLVKVIRDADERLTVDFDVRDERHPHALSRYRAILGDEDVLDLAHLRDNPVPIVGWNETMAGTGGGLIPFGSAGLFVGIYHGQREITVMEDGVIRKKREYHLGLAICNGDGEMLYLSEDPVLSPGDLPGSDLRRDVLALYTDHRGEIVYDGSGRPAVRLLVQRGDRATYVRDIPLNDDEIEFLSTGRRPQSLS